MRKVYGLDIKGPTRVERVNSLPTWTPDDEGRILYDLSSNKFYYGDNTGWVYAGGGGTGAGDTRLYLEDFDPDDEMDGVHNGIMWGMASTVGLSPIKDGAIWVDFPFKGNWSSASDINFNIEYAVTSQHSGLISLNAAFWIVNDGSIPDPDVASYGAVEDEIDPADLNVYDIMLLSNIKIPASEINSPNCDIKMKLWRNVDGSGNNHTGWLEIVRLVAFQ